MNENTWYKLKFCISMRFWTSLCHLSNSFIQICCFFGRSLLMVACSWAQNYATSWLVYVTDSKASDFKSVLRSGWVQNKMKSRFLGCTTFWARQKCVQLQKRLTSTVIEYILSNFWSFQLFALRHNIMLQKTSLSCLCLCSLAEWCRRLMVLLN